ncbi:MULTISPECIES: endo-1,4-beta-xylanase [Paenibacillus]|nr:endo-1,4-beta-xylanase [Paenibacillus amylolyticus]OMF47777.1 1,4-beta-xylanase [Paenibacillus amylolyticus]
MRKMIFLKALKFVLMITLLVPSYWAAQSVHAAEGENTLILSHDFEDGTVQSWSGRGEVETLHASAVAARTGDYGLEVSGRAMTWHGPALDVTELLEVGQTYVFTGWVKLPAGASSTNLNMSLQRTLPDTTHYENLTFGTASAGGWTKLTAQFKMLEPANQLSVYFEVPDRATASFYVDDFRLEKLPDLGPIVIEEDIPSLQDAFAGKFRIGTAFTNNELLTEPDKQLLTKHFDSLTPGNVLKWDSTEPQEGMYNFSGSDAAVAFAAANGQEIRGHTLVWHTQTPDWVFHDANGNLVSKTVLYERMQQHIETVMERYQGQIYAWDVVNEVIDASEPDGLRRSLWYQIAGEEYIEKAFEFAHAADPDAKLFINDYNTHEPAKSQALYNLITRLQAKGVPIDGVGHQTHISLFYPTLSEIESSIVKFKALGLETHITELDVSVYSNDSQSYDIFPEELKTQQAALYKSLFQIFLRHTDTVKNVTLWGKDDANTWLRTFPVARNNWPLLFDERLQSKPAYWSVLETVQVEAVPAAPQNLTATAVSDNSINLSWSASASATSYTVNRSLTAAGPYTSVAAVSGTSYKDMAVSAGTTYYYVVNAVNSVGKSVNSVQASAKVQGGGPPEPAGNLTLAYRAGDTNLLDNQMKPQFVIYNNGTSTVSLNELTIRYWYTVDGEKQQSFFCDYAQLGGSQISGSIVKLPAPVPGADHYLELKFGTGAGVIPVGGTSGEIHTRLHKADWSNYSEGDDYSFNPLQTSFADWTKVTLYRNGELVWGVEPIS